MASSPDPLVRYLERPGKRRLAAAVRAYHRFVWETAFRATGNQEDADDICQDVFLKLLLEPPAAGDVRSPAGYLAWRVLGRARFLERSVERRRAHEKAFAEMLGAATGIDGPGDPAIDAATVREALEELPEPLRTAVELRFVAGLAPAEVAAALGIGERALFLRLENARETLRRRLAPAALAPAFLESPVRPELPEPPADLLERLVHIARSGAALAPGAGALVPLGILGGVLMAKKIALTLAAVLLLLLGYFVVRSSVQTDAPPQVASVPSPAGTEPAPRTAEPPAPHGVEEAAPAADEEKPEPPRAILRGLVADGDGQRIAGATVKVIGRVTPEESAELQRAGYRDVPEGEYERVGKAGPDGEYSLEGLLPDHVVVEAFAEGYFTEGGPDIDLPPGRAAWQELRLDRLCRITGSIRDESGNPLPGGCLLVRRRCCPEAPLEFGRNDDSGACYAGFPAGPSGEFDTGHALWIRRAIDRDDLAAWADGRALQYASLDEKSFDGYAARLDFRMKPEMPVTVRVKDPGGGPVPDAEVGLGDPWFPYPAAWTDAAGLARVEHMDARPRSIRVAKEGFAAASVEARPGASEGLEVVLLPLGKEIVARVVFQGPAAESLRGRVQIDLEERDGAGAFQRARLLQAQWYDRRAGRRTFQPRGPGVFRIVYRHGEDERETEPFRFSGEETVVVELPVDVSVRPPGLPAAPAGDSARRAISGIIVDAATGKPRLDATAEAFFHPRGLPPSPWTGEIRPYLRDIKRDFLFPSFPGDSASAGADAEGRFVIPLPPGEALDVVLHARSRTPWYHDPSSTKLWWSSPIELKIPRGQSVGDVELRVSPGGSVEGRVTGTDGAPRRGEVVAIYWPPVLMARITNDEGTFRFDGIPPGSYALEPLGASATVGIMAGGRGILGPLRGMPSPREFFELRVEVKEGETSQRDLDLSREALGQVEGSVDPEVATSGRVHFGMAVAGTFIDESTFGDEAKLSDGRFRAAGLFPGRYRFWIEGPSAGEAEAEVPRAAIVPVRIQAPAGVLIVPIAATDDGPTAAVRVVEVERLPGPLARHSDRAEPFGGWRASEEKGTLRIERLLGGILRVKLVALGFCEAWTEPTLVREGEESRAPEVALEPGSEIRVRVEGPDGKPLPGTLEFHVSRAEAAGPEDAAFTARKDGETWVLSAFRAGEYRVSADRDGRQIGKAEVTVEGTASFEVRIVSGAQ